MSPSNQIENASGSVSWWQRFRQRRTNRWCLKVLYGLIFIALTADFWANEKPLYCEIEGKAYWPVFYSYGKSLGLVSAKGDLERMNWLNQEYERVIRCPIPYSSTTIDRKNMRALGPWQKQRVDAPRFRHWLGTDELGKDVAAGLIHGTRIALTVGLVAMLVASLIGITLGAIAGYFGDNLYTWPRIRFWIFGVSLLPWIFYGWLIPVPFGLGTFFLGRPIWVIATLAFVVVLSGWLTPRSAHHRMKAWPLDFGIMRLVEILNSIPALLLLLAVVATLEKSSLFMVMAIIGLIRWTGIARFVRAEMLRIREQPYIEASRVIGLREHQILWRHALPNSLRPVLITIAFGISGAVLLEAFLSFLGIGLPPDVVTWGTLLNKIKSNPEAWWLAFFPGMAIFATVTLFNLIGEGLTEAMDV